MVLLPLLLLERRNRRLFGDTALFLVPNDNIPNSLVKCSKLDNILKVHVIGSGWSWNGVVLMLFKVICSWESVGWLLLGGLQVEHY